MPEFNSALPLLGKRQYPDDRVHDEMGLIEGVWIEATPLLVFEDPDWITLPVGAVQTMTEGGGIEVQHAFEAKSATVCLEVAVGTRLTGPLRYRRRAIAKVSTSPVRPLLGAIGLAVAFALIWRGLLPNILNPTILMQRSIHSALFAVVLVTAPLGLCVMDAIRALSARRQRSDFDSKRIRRLQVITLRP